MPQRDSGIACKDHRPDFAHSLDKPNFTVGPDREITRTSLLHPQRKIL